MSRNVPEVENLYDMVEMSDAVKQKSESLELKFPKRLSRKK